MAPPLITRPTFLPLRLTRQHALFGFICVVWGLNWAAMKIGVTAVPPGFFSGTRWTLAGLVLLIWQRGRGNSIRIPLRLLPRLIWLSMLLIPINATIMLYGLRLIGSGLAAVINSALTPIGLFVLAVAYGQERFSWRQAGGIALGIFGILLLFGPRAMAGQLQMAEVLGALGVIVGNLSYCLGTVLSRPLMRQLPPVLMAASTNFAGGVIMLVLSLAFEPGVGVAMQGDWGWPAWLSWGFMVLFGSLGATIFYFFLVRDWGASRTGTYAFVSPVIAVSVGIVFLGERTDMVEMLGMAVMLAAAALVLWRN
jgi:drug/metabolite transporter (DMT)-like permease